MPASTKPTETFPLGQHLLDLARKVAAIDDAKAIALLSQELRQGSGFAAQAPSVAAAYAPAYLSRIREIPALLQTAMSMVNDAGRPPGVRLATLAALHYVAAPDNAVSEKTGSGYGYLDDWLVLTAMLVNILGFTPGPSGDQLRLNVQLVATGLASDRLALVNDVLQTIGLQVALIMQMPATYQEQAFKQLLATDVPATWTPPPPIAASFAAASALPAVKESWSTGPGGTFYTDHKGTSSLSFSGGGSVVMSGNDIAVF